MESVTAKLQLRAGVFNIKWTPVIQQLLKGGVCLGLFTYLGTMDTDVTGCMCMYNDKLIEISHDFFFSFFLFSRVFQCACDKIWG